MDFETEAHTLFGNVTFSPTEDLQLFASTLWHDGQSAIQSVALDPSDLPQQPLGLDFVRLSDVVDQFSSIEIRRFTQAFGFNYRASDRVVLHGSAEYDDYDDRDPYIYSVDGRQFFGQIGVVLMF